MNGNFLTQTLLLFLCPLFLLAGCANEADPVSRKKPPGDGLYYDYQVWGEEGIEEVTIRLQFRKGDAEGAVMELPAGNVRLDDKPLPVDSTRFTGAYYEVSEPAAEFKGEHTITFTGKLGKQHRETFSFAPFSLAGELPETVKKRPFRLVLDGLPETATPMRLVMTDTSMASDDVNEELVVEKGVIEITEEHLANLTTGPVTLEIYREEEKPGGIGTATQGKLMITYGLKREINLVR